MTSTTSPPSKQSPGRPLLRTAAGVVALAAGVLLATAPIAGTAASAATGQTSASVEQNCAAPGPGQAACFAQRRTSVAQPSAIAGIAADPHTVVPDVTPAGFGPSDLSSAYKYSTAGGAGQTVAIVDAYNNPNAASDLATYRAQYGLPACTVAGGCFTQVNQTGGSTLPANDAGWAGEIDLDIQMVSAVCPNCKILLVEATSNSYTDLYAAEDYATAHAKFVSNSWGGPESSGETSSDTHFNKLGVAITASSGDSGYGVEYPAASPYVTAVGGTTLSRASNGRGWTETAWSGAGAGCSAYETKPSWQSSVNTDCTRRAVADLSAVANPSTGVAVYQTYGASGWQVYGGTSVASPIIASIWALAGTPNATDQAASYPYHHTVSLFDVTSGSDGSCGTLLCTAAAGYDGPTGLGTPNGTADFTPGGALPSCSGFTWTATTYFTAGTVFFNYCKGTLQMQTDGNFVLYDKTNRAIWATNTAGNPGAETVFQSDGNLVVYTAAGTPIWATNTAGRAVGGWFNFQSDGNLVIYNSSTQPVWASNTVH